MKKYLFLILTPLALFLLPACQEVNKIIDDTFTFNLNKSFDFPIPALSPTGVDIPVDVPIPIDSAEYAKNKTNLSLLKSAKLTRLVFSFSDSTFLMANSVDTLVLSVKNDTMPPLTLATYHQSVDSMKLSNADFVKYIKDPKSKFSVLFRLDSAPKTDITAHADFTITYVARPF
jgi:isocitrate dehydrogenase kinase/phosphatase